MMKSIKGKDSNGKQYNDLKLLALVNLALNDDEVEDYESLIKITCQYGKNFGVTREEVKRVLEKKLIDFL